MAKSKTPRVTSDHVGGTPPTGNRAAQRRAKKATTKTEDRAIGQCVHGFTGPNLHSNPEQQSVIDAMVSNTGPDLIVVSLTEFGVEDGQTPPYDLPVGAKVWTVRSEYHGPEPFEGKRHAVALIASAPNGVMSEPPHQFMDAIRALRVGRNNQEEAS